MTQAHTDGGIDATLLLDLMTQVSEFGSTGDGGLNRPVLTDAHKAARDWLCDQFKSRGYTVKVDAIGNLFGQIDLAGPDAPLIMLGSHLDSQPYGGRFDGTFGVVAALAAVETLRADGNATPTCNYVVVDWMNEEGARFQPSLLGASVYAGACDLDWALARRDRDGLTVGAELERIGYLGTDTAPDPRALIEVHVEGDAKMETAGARIAPFHRHWGATKIRIEVTGEQNHTGPTPMEDRKDALLAAAQLITRIRDFADGAADTLYTSVARLDVHPNSPNIVPGRAVLFCELRAPEQPMLDWAEDALRGSIPEIAETTQTEIEIAGIDRRSAGKFDPRLVALVDAAAARFGYPAMALDTIGGHDSVAVNARLPAVVLAVPSVNGVIHRNDEFTSDADLTAGGDVVFDMIRRIDAAGGDLDAAAARPT